MLHISMFLTRLAEKARSEEGAGLAEYALLLALIAILCIGALQALQGGISATLEDVANNL